MKKLTFALAALGLTAGCVMPPEDITDEDLAAFDAALASVGCKLETERQYLPVELQTGLTREKLIEVAQYRLTLEEAVSLESGGIALITGACAPVEATDVAET